MTRYASNPNTISTGWDGVVIGRSAGYYTGNPHYGPFARIEGVAVPQSSEFAIGRHAMLTRWPADYRGGSTP